MSLVCGKIQNSCRLLPTTLSPRRNVKEYEEQGWNAWDLIITWQSNHQFKEEHFWLWIITAKLLHWKLTKDGKGVGL